MSTSPRPSGGGSIALSAADMSPGPPEPLSLNTAATRPTYAGVGLLSIICWIKRVAMNGPRFGWKKMLSSAWLSELFAYVVIFGSVVQFVQAATFVVVEPE